MEAIQTLTTCAANCWFAREDVCRCFCGGVNHGVLKDGSGEQPVRSKRAKGNRYELLAVVYVPNDAYIATLHEVDNILTREGYTETLEFFSGEVKTYAKHDRSVGDDYHVQVAPKSSFKWPELAAYKDTADDWHRPQLIWKKVG